LIIIAFILVFTFLFDMLDMRPRIGSFGFVRSSTYLFYYGLRVAFGWLASAIIGPSKLVTDPALLGFVSVMAAITTLQNFALNIGGQDVADLKGLFETYRGKMLSEETERIADKKKSDLMVLASEIAAKIELDEIGNCLVLTLNRMGEDASSRLAELRKVAGEDRRLLAMLLASDLAYKNKVYAETLLRQRRQPRVE